MPEYHFYCLDDLGRIANPYDVMAPNDLAAIEMAQEHCKDGAIEVWEGYRRIIQVRKKAAAA